MPILAFRCSEGHLTERLVRGQAAGSLPCETCSRPAARQSVYAVAVTGFVRTPLDQRQYKMGDFKEASAEIAYRHEQAERKEGTKLPAPPLWQTAKREAKRLQKLGVRDSQDLR